MRATEIVRKMRAAEMISAGVNIESYMKQTAARLYNLEGITIRAGSATQFVGDLQKHNLIDAEGNWNADR